MEGKAQSGRVITRMGVVVGLLVPPAGSTVTPTLSADVSPAASTGAVLPSVGSGSSPAERADPVLSSHSS